MFCINTILSNRFGILATMKTTVRLHPSYETNNTWGGQTEDVPLTGPVEFVSIKLENISCLWYFQFKDETPTIYQYFGVLDFDFKRVFVNGGRCPKQKDLLEDSDIKKAITILERMFENFTVYFSGRKGIHAYIYDPKLFTYCPPAYAQNRKSWLRSYLVHTYGEELYGLLDDCLYHINTGIRPYSLAHPKTGILPFTIYQKGPHTCIWTYLMETEPWKNIGLYEPELNTLIPHRPKKTAITGAMRIETAGEISADMEKIVCDYFKSQPGKTFGAPIRLERVQGGKCANLYNIINTTYCPIKRGAHSGRSKCYLYLYSHHATFKCFSKHCGTDSEFTLRKYMPPLTNLSELCDGMLERGEIAQKHFELVTIPPDQKYVAIGDIQWAVGNEDVGKYGYIAAPMSCGKTTSLRAYIEAQNPEFSCLLIVVRQSQAHTFAPIYPDMVNYLDCKPGSLYGENRLVVCINSLTRIFSPGGFFKQYDLLILDEFESILDVSTNPSMSNGKSFQTEIWETLIALIKGCKRTIFMDGIPTEASLKYLDRIGILPLLRIVEMPRQVDYRTYIMYNHGQIFIEEFEKKIKDGKKIVLVSNCKAILQDIFDQIHVPSGNKMIITGDSERDVKLTSADPDQHWNKDLFAFNSAVGPGTSFNPQLYDEMGVIVTPNSSSPQVLFQMINRIRTLNDKTVRMIILHGENTKVPTRAELKERKMQNIINMHGKQSMFPKTGFFEKMDKEYCKLTIHQVDQKIAKELVATQMMSLRHEDDLFIDMLVEQEYRKRLLENSNEYAKELFMLIRRNGGIVREELKPKVEIIKTTTRILKSSSREHDLERSLELTKNVVWSVPAKYEGKITSTVLKNFNKKIPRNDMDAHFMWLAFRKALLHESEQSLYEQEFFQIITKKRAINNTLLFSNGLLEKIEELFEDTGIEYDPKTAIVKGRVFTSMEFFEAHVGYINELCGEILEAIRAKTQISYKLSTATKDSVTKYNKSALANIQKVLGCFGIYSEYKSTTERPPTGRKSSERFVKAFLEIDEKIQKFRMSISNINPSTGDQDYEAYEKTFPAMFGLQ